MEQNGSQAKKVNTKGIAGFTGKKKSLCIGAGAVLLAVILLLVIVNPANSPSSVFNRYLNCLCSENADAFCAISYEANFSNTLTAENVAESYKGRFSSADPSYSVGGKVNLLKDTGVKVTKTVTPTQTEIASRRANLAANYRNTGSITDIRNLTFTIKRGDLTSTGTAELICVTGKWYIADVTGI